MNVEVGQLKKPKKGKQTEVSSSFKGWDQTFKKRKGLTVLTVLTDSSVNFFEKKRIS
jgi:hypothetical protein